MCVTVTLLFAAEYREGTDAVLLSARHGRVRLVAAKLIAAVLYATVLFALATAIICGMSFAFYGFEGAALPIQNYTLISPYALTMGQAVALFLGVFYLAMLGMLALTLALSARLEPPPGGVGRTARPPHFTPYQPPPAPTAAVDALVPGVCHSCRGE